MSASLPLADELIAQLARTTDPRASLEALLAELTNVELAALMYDYRDFWARTKQIPPPGAWRSWGLCTGRGFGKTWAISNWINEEVRAGRAGRIALIAQKEDKTMEVMVDGESGLIATAPPWFRPHMEKGRLVWPNGAQAFIHTPEVPDALRGPEHHLAWASEMVAWPAATRDAAFSNLRLGLRLGYARLVWDTTPKRRHPLIRYLLERARKDPRRHIVVRGSTAENAAHIPPETLQEWLDEYGGTQRGREELDGEFLDDSDGALWKQNWIDRSRRDTPTTTKRRILSLDPAISDRRGTDTTGISDLALGADGQVYVLADYSGKHSWEEWGAFTVAHYMEHRCDCVVVETDRGGDGIAANIRAAAKELGIRVVVVELKARTRHDRGTLYVKEIRARQGGSKGARAAPVATLTEKGKVSFVRAELLSWPEGLTAPHDRPAPTLEALEDTITTWEPEMSGRSPDEMDAMVHGVWELANLWDRMADNSRGFKGIEKVTKEITGGAATSRARGLGSVTAALPKGEWGNKL